MTEPTSAAQPSALLSQPPPADSPRSVRGRSMDAVASLVGAAIAALALVWVLYDNVLPTAGWVGFVFLWYIAFVGLYALVVSLNHARPVVIDKVSAVLV